MSKRIIAVALCLLVSACDRKETVTDPTLWQPPAASETRLDMLEVRAVGILVDRLRRPEVWTSVRLAEGRKVISDDPATEERDFNMRQIIERRREGAALAGALSPSVEGWTTPIVDVWSGDTKDEHREGARASNGYITSIKNAGGLHWHRLVKVDHVFSDDAGEILETAFRFFEQHPDAPLLILFSSVPGSKREGGPFENFTQTEVALLFAAPQRLQWLRSFAKYTRKPDGTEYPRFWKWRSPPPVPFTPTKFFPEPWTVEQFKQFDALPVLARVHRAQRVSYRIDGQGKSVMSEAPEFARAKPLKEAARIAAFADGWAQSMRALGTAEAWRTDAKAGPARVLFDHGKPASGGHLIPATRTLMHREEDGAARYDLLDPTFGFNTFNILGNMRTTHPLAQWALAALATQEQKNASVTLDLRSPDYATITVFTPAPAQAPRPASR